MQMKSKLLLVMCLIKSCSLFDYYDQYDSKERIFDPDEVVDPYIAVDHNEVKFTLWTTAKKELTTQVTENPRKLGGVCVLKYKERRFRRVTYVKTYQQLYVAECCGGLKNCTKPKTIYRFQEDYKELKPLRRYHQVCCKGYERDYKDPYLPGGNIKCLPVCNPPCINGTCVARQNCSCYNRGLMKHPDRKYECIDACLSKCKDATCVDFRLCQCDFGYRSIDENYCEPVCPGGCTNGECILPFKCKCYPGYVQDPEDRYRCNPICTNGCLNGTCIGPELCECPPGEKFDTEFKTCIPRLCFNDCGVGTCIPSPNRCECPDNYFYSKENDTCIAFCDQPCYGGVCVAPNNCVYFKNFHKVGFGCIDNCNNNCGYGKCMPDGSCKCDEKLYVKPKNVVQKLDFIFDYSGWVPYKGEPQLGVEFNAENNERVYDKIVMHCIPRADNCFETGGKVLAPWICKCSDGKRYITPNEQQIQELGLNKSEKYCLPGTNVKAEFIQRMEKIYEVYKDVELIP